MTASSDHEMDWAGTGDDGGGQGIQFIRSHTSRPSLIAPSGVVGGPSEDRSTDDGSNAYEIAAQITTHTTTGDVPAPVQPLAPLPYMTYRQRLSKKKTTAARDEPFSTAFKKRRVQGPPEIEFLESLKDALENDPDPTLSTQHTMRMLEARLAERRARLERRQARLEERAEDSSELSEGNSSHSSAPHYDFSEAMAAIYQMDATASVQPYAAAFTHRDTREASDNYTEEDIVLYSVAQEEPSTRPPSSFTSEGGQVPDSELEYASSLSGAFHSNHTQVRCSICTHVA